MRAGWNQRLNLIRCVAAYSVVFLHVRFPGDLGVAINCLARFAVPLFFLSAGYFSYGRPAPVLRRRVGRCTGQLLLACLPPLLLGCALAARRGEEVGRYLESRITAGGVLRLLLVQEIPLPYVWPIWFLAALVMIYVLWWGLTRLLGRDAIPWNRLAVLALLTLALHLWLGEGRIYRGLKPVPTLWLRNVWLDGLPFFTLGGWLGSQEERLRRGARPWMVYGALGLGCALSLFERSRGDYVDLHLGSILMALSAMTAAIVWPDLKRDTWLNRLLSRGGALTFSIYALHIPLYGLLLEWREVPLFGWILDHPAITPLAVAGVCTLLAMGLAGIRGLGKPDCP